MKRIQQIFALLLCLAMLAGCGSPGGNIDTNADTSPEAVTEEATEEPADKPAEEADDTAAKDTPEQLEGEIEFWNDKTAETEKSVLDKITQGIEDNSGIEVTMVGYPDVAAYQTAIQQSIEKSDGPGMFTWWSGFQLETLIKNGLLEDLTDQWEEYYIPAGVSADVADALTVDGKIYAAPYSVLYNAVIYNKNVFEEAGADVPTTFDEFLEVCAKIKETGVTPIGLKADSWAGFIWFQQLLAIHDPALYNGICDGSIAYTDPRVLEVMEVWQDMLDKGYFSHPNEDLGREFATGKVAMMLEPTLSVPNLVEDYGMVSGEDFDAFVPPSATGGKGTIFFEVAPLCIPSANDKKDEAKAAVRGFLSPETQKILADEQGNFSTSTVQLDDPTIANIAAMGGDGDSYDLILRFYENTPAELRDVALDELARFIISEGDAPTILATIQEKADEVFGE